MINNEFYHDLGDKWYTSQGDAVALLRRENATKLPWVRAQISTFHGSAPCTVLDVGCGGGFLTLGLAQDGHFCTGVDVSAGVIHAAQVHDHENRCNWRVSPAENLPFADQSFDVVCIMDVLEHIHDFRLAISEGARVLKPGGTFLLHTFNRTWLSWLFAERGLQWFIKGAPDHIHDWAMFIKPVELKIELARVGFTKVETTGIHPVVLSRAFGSLLFRRRVPPNFRFAVGGNTQIGYLACARRDLQTGSN